MSCHFNLEQFLHLLIHLARGDGVGMSAQHKSEDHRTTC